jgi:hypothetical protein
VQKRILRTMLLTALAIVMVLGLSSAALAKYSDWTDMSIQVTGPYGISLQQVAGVSSGFADNTWRPFQDITRAQFTKMAVQAFNIPLKNPATPSFSDVPYGSTFYQYIEGARAAKAINGKTATTFAPNDKITRQQAIAIISRWLVQDEKERLQDWLTPFYSIGMYSNDDSGLSAAGDGGFEDPFPWDPYNWGLRNLWLADQAAGLLDDLINDSGAVSTVFDREVLFGRDTGFVQGDADNNVNPLNNMSRIQAAAFLIRAATPPAPLVAQAIGLRWGELVIDLEGQGPAETVWAYGDKEGILDWVKKDEDKPFDQKTNPFVWKYRWTATVTDDDIGECEIDVTVEAPKAKGKPAQVKLEVGEVATTDPENPTTYVVTGYEVVDPGEGYTPTDVGEKLKVDNPPGFVPATATAKILGNQVVGINVTSYGTGYPYTVNEEEFAGGVVIEAPAKGTQATARVWIKEGAVTWIELIQGGSGYQNAPNVTIGTGDVVAELSIGTLTSDGGVATIDIYKPGTGYGKTPPKATVPAPIKEAAQAVAKAENGMITGITLKVKDGVPLAGKGYALGEKPKVIFPAPTGQGGETARAEAVTSAHVVSGFAIHDPGYGYYCDGKVAASSTLSVEVLDRADKGLEGYKVVFELLGTPNATTNGIYNPKAYLRDPAYDFNGNEAEVTGRTLATGYTLKNKMAEVTINLDVDKAAHLKGRDSVQSQILVKVYAPNGELVWEQIVTCLWDTSGLDTGSNGTTTSTT